MLIMVRRHTPLLVVILHIEFVLKAPFAAFLAITGIIVYLSHINTKKDIVFQKADLGLLQEIVAQMEKDIALSGEQYTFEAEDIPGLIMELAQLCRRFDKGAQLENLLYRVDLKPKFGSIPDYEVLANKLWDRSFQKVWFRRVYSKKSLD